MSQIEFVKTGEFSSLERLVTSWNTIESPILKLFTATTAPEHDDAAVADFTEAAFVGYLAWTIDDWGIVTHLADGLHTRVSPGVDPIFTNTDIVSHNVLGAFLIDPDQLAPLMAWGYFLGGGFPVAIPAGGDLTVNITINLKTIFEHP